MKKILLTITSLVVTLFAMAQAPNMLNYQGVARNAAGNVLPNQSVGLRLSILAGSAAGTPVFVENRTVVTNAFGLFNVQVGGPGGTVTLGSIAGVNWTAFGAGSGTKFLQVEIDPTGGTSYVNVGSTQMLSVPYALYAAGGAPVGPAGGDLTGTYPNPTILIPFLRTQSVPTNTMIGMTNSATTGVLGALQGTSASNDANAVAVQGTMSSATSGISSAALRGLNNGTTNLGFGVWGSHAGAGTGVNGTTVSGTGVNGSSTSGAGVNGSSTSGFGVSGISNTNNSGNFQNTNAANTAATVAVTTNGTGDGVSSITTGTLRAGMFQVNNAASGANAIETFTNGAATSWGIRANSSGLQGAGLFVQSNATNTASNVQSNQAGLGRAGFFQTTNTANTADAVFAQTNTTSTTPSAVRGNAGTSGTTVVAKKGVWGDSDLGVGVYGTSNSLIGVAGTTTTGTGVSAFAFTTGTALSATSLTGISGSITTPAGNASNTLNVSTAGTGNAASIDNTNAANVSNVVIATNANIANGATSPTTGGGAAIFARKGAGLTSFITNPTASYSTIADPAAAQGIATLGVVNNGLGVVGIALNNGTAVLGQAVAPGGVGVFALNTSTGYGLVTVGRVQIQGQGAGINKVLSSDAVGNATWNTLAAIGGVSGLGTLNYVPKWTPNGTTLGNSQFFDDGTNIGVNTAVPNAKFDVVNPSNTNRAGFFTNTSTTNPSSALFVQNNTLTGAATIEGSALTAFLNPFSGAVNTYSLTTPVGIKGFASPTNTVGFAGGTGVQGSSGSGMGVVGLTDVGTAMYAQAMTTGYALQTIGKVQIAGQGAGAGKLLSSDATGNATWNTSASLNIVSGNGTLNYMTKWSPDGNTISNSQLFDNGTNVGLGTTTPGARLDIPNAGASSRGAMVVNSNVTNNSSAVFAQTNNISSASFFEGSAVTGLMPLNVATTMLSGPTTVKGIASVAAPISQFSGIGVQGASATGFGVVGNSNDGIALAGLAWGTGYGLITQGKVQISGQGAAAGKILSSTNASGDALWNTAAALNIVSGNGTLNFVPKWTPNGTTLGNSMAFDNGNTYSIGSTTPTTDIMYVSNAAGNTFSTINQVGTNVGGISFTRANTYKYDIAMNANNDFYIQNYTSASTALTILAANANVGINQTNPAAKLDVNGTFKLTDGTQGANNVLTSDAAGNASWTPRIDFRAIGYSGGAITVSSTLIVDTEVYDEGNGYNPATGVFTAPAAGLYHFDAGIRGSTANIGRTNICFVSSIQSFFSCSSVDVTASNQTYSAVNINGDIMLAAGETVVVVIEPIAGSYTPFNNSNYIYFNGHRVR